MKVLFIIPTLGRPTLMDSLDSLIKQTSDDWSALVVGDGIPLHLPPHPSIYALSVPKMGKGRAAGNVRNGGIHLVLREASDSSNAQGKMVKPDYIGFLDDDDILTPDYVDLLTSYTSKGDDKPDVVIFRMNDHGLGILPPPKQDAILPSRVGISFAVAFHIFEEGHFFEPSGMEDYHYLKKMETLGKTIVYAEEVTYLVRPKARGRKVALKRTRGEGILEVR